MPGFVIISQARYLLLALLLPGGKESEQTRNLVGFSVKTLTSMPRLMSSSTLSIQANISIGGVLVGGERWRSSVACVQRHWLATGG